VAQGVGPEFKPWYTKKKKKKTEMLKKSEFEEYSIICILVLHTSFTLALHSCDQNT
jgi:hypothetical protein